MSGQTLWRIAAVVALQTGASRGIASVIYYPDPSTAEDQTAGDISSWRSEEFAIYLDVDRDAQPAVAPLVQFATLPVVLPPPAMPAAARPRTAGSGAGSEQSAVSLFAAAAATLAVTYRRVRRNSKTPKRAG